MNCNNRLLLSLVLITSFGQISSMSLNTLYTGGSSWNKSTSHFNYSQMGLNKLDKTAKEPYVFGNVSPDTVIYSSEVALVEKQPVFFKGILKVKKSLATPHIESSEITKYDLEKLTDENTKLNRASIYDLSLSEKTPVHKDSIYDLKDIFCGVVLYLISKK